MEVGWVLDTECRILFAAECVGGGKGANVELCDFGAEEGTGIFWEAE